MKLRDLFESQHCSPAELFDVLDKIVEDEQGDDFRIKGWSLEKDVIELQVESYRTEVDYFLELRCSQNGVQIDGLTGTLDLHSLHADPDALDKKSGPTNLIPYADSAEDTVYRILSHIANAIDNDDRQEEWDEDNDEDGDEDR